MTNVTSMNTGNFAGLIQTSHEDSSGQHFPVGNLPIEIQLDIFSRGSFKDIQSTIHTIPHFYRYHTSALWRPLSRPLYDALGPSLPQPTPPFDRLCCQGLAESEVERMNPATRGAGARSIIDQCAEILLYKQLRGNSKETKSMTQRLCDTTHNAVTICLAKYHYTANVGAKAKAEAWERFTENIDKCEEYIDIFFCHDQKEGTNCGFWLATYIGFLRKIAEQHQAKEPLHKLVETYMCLLEFLLRTEHALPSSNARRDAEVMFPPQVLDTPV